MREDHRERIEIFCRAVLGNTALLSQSLTNEEENEDRGKETFKHGMNILVTIVGSYVLSQIPEKENQKILFDLFHESLIETIEVHEKAIRDFHNNDEAI